jgi:hypothetical protein
MNVTNIKSLLLDIKNSFDFNDDNWKDKAVEFIATGIELVGCSSSFERKIEEFEVENYRIPYPHLAQNIIEIEDDCCFEIPIINSTTLFADCKCCTLTSAYKHAEINPGWIHFNFETGTIKVKYYTLPLDEDGFPLIAKDAKVFEALGWFVAFKLILSGNKHHTITNWKEAYDMWRMLLPKAQNSLKEPTPYFMRLMGNAWADPTLRNRLHEFI